MKFILIHYWNNEDNGGIEVEYYDTIEEAKRWAFKGDTIAQLIEEVA